LNFPAPDGVILRLRRACPERSRRDLARGGYAPLRRSRRCARDPSGL